MALRSMFTNINYISNNSCSVNVSFDLTCLSTENVIKNIASIKEGVDVYCWYEGEQGLPQKGANFMKKEIFDPLFSKKDDVKFLLYSLRGWDFRKYNKIDKMPQTSQMADSVAKIDPKKFEILDSFEFFRFCNAFSQSSTIYQYIKSRLIKKQYLVDLSNDKKELGITVGDLFDNKPSLLTCIYTLDVVRAYSLMQYVEGIFLVNEAVRRRLNEGFKNINIAFVLPNDEGKYYTDLPDEIEEMLRLIYGEKLNDININISFQFFSYGTSLSERPYIDKSKKPIKVNPKDIAGYLTDVSQKKELKLNT